jgi:hypothetical protein
VDPVGADQQMAALAALTREPGGYPVGILVELDDLLVQVVAIPLEAGQQPPVQRVVGGEPVAEGVLVGDVAVPVHIAHPARRGAYLADVQSIILGKVAYGCRVQDYPGSAALQRGPGAFVHLDVVSCVAQDQRSRQPTQGPSHHDNARPARSCAHFTVPDLRHQDGAATPFTVENAMTREVS